MSEPGFTRKGRLTAICMLICAVVMIGLVLAGVLQGGPSLVAHVVAK
jgi:hypothetical protein